MGFGDRIDYTDEPQEISVLEILVNLFFAVLGFILIISMLCTGLIWWIYYLFIR